MSVAAGDLAIPALASACPSTLAGPATAIYGASVQTDLHRRADARSRSANTDRSTSIRPGRLELPTASSERSLHPILWTTAELSTFVDSGYRGSLPAASVGRMRFPVLALLTTLVFLMGTAPAAADNTFGWPLEPRPTVARPFDPPEQNWLPGHRGVDLASRAGQTVLAAGDGIVVFAGTVAGKPVVSIDHPGGLRTTYEPVAATVATGRRISAGDPLGTVEAGHEGCPVEACLHWGLRRDRDSYLNPLPLVERTVIRLEPV